MLKFKPVSIRYKLMVLIFFGVSIGIVANLFFLAIGAVSEQRRQSAQTLNAFAALQPVHHASRMQLMLLP